MLHSLVTVVKLEKLVLMYIHGSGGKVRLSVIDLARL